jgi:hypothetical protein
MLKRFADGGVSTAAKMAAARIGPRSDEAAVLAKLAAIVRKIAS